MINVLHIEDNSGDARLIEEMLKDSWPRRYNLTRAVRVKAAIELLSKDPSIDIILSDIAVPDSQGGQTFKSLQMVAADLPVVFITGTHDESLAVQALQKGAQDYLLKGFFDREGLERTIRYSIERKKFQRQVTEAQNKTRLLRQKARLLKKKGEQLAELNAVKDDFISLASHQLRTPATGVKQYLGMLLQGFAGEIPEQHRELLQVAYDSNERQLTIINDLLKVAQIDSGRMEMRKQLVDLKKLLKNVIDEQQETFAKKDITITLKTQSKNNNIYADPERIRMVFENIIDNAGKYSPRRKSVEVIVSCKPDVSLVEVKDEGVGIDKNDINKVFEKFSRIQNPLSNTVGGSGLGLYWVKRVVDLHGGNVSVQSELNKGTTFKIEIPSGKKNV